jgi:hypothetical protein
MFNSVVQLWNHLRARWRWAHGRCSRCNRSLYATFPNNVAADPNCPVCKDERATDLRMGLWGGLADLPAEVGVLSDHEFPPVETHR